MSTLSDCCAPTCCTPSTPPVNIPGSMGATGAAGTNGTDGISAFTVTTNDFVVPADTVTPVTINVASSIWMVIGQRVIIGQGLGGALANPGPGSFHVTVIPSSTSVTLLWDNFPGDVAAGSTISSGAVVSPSGRIPASPMTIALGGTSATTKAGAQTALGLGQDAIVSSGNALSQDITNSLVQVGAIDVTIPALGTYLLQGHVSVEMRGATFVASRVVTVEIRNVTQNVTLATMSRNTGIQATVVLPSTDYVLPYLNDATAAANDHIQMRLSINTVSSAGVGTFVIVGGSLSATPLRKS